MTTPAPFGTACPNCGAAIRFLWAQAVQTTCAYCRSVLVRDDLNLALVGKQADFPSTGSPIQIGTEGTWQGRSFLVVGRLAYGWERGRWNEWHCRMMNGASAWLSDAQLEYAMSVEAAADTPLPPESGVRVGDFHQWDAHAYQVASKTRARYLGTEGELPFTSYSRDSCVFVDLQTDDGKFATIDYSDKTPTLYLGEYVDFEAFAFKQLREFEGWSR
jgi:Domain of unknown function (DUF4178)